MYDCGDPDRERPGRADGEAVILPVRWPSAECPVLEGWVVEGLAIFALVAVLQIPGKSNFAVISLAGRHPPRDVALGASVGLAAATVVSVTLGYGAETLLAPYLLWVKVVGGGVLLGFGVREILSRPAPVHEPGEGTAAAAHTPLQVRTVALGLAFLLEMGDNTQVLAIVFVASTRNVLLVYVAATVGLLLITVLSARGAGYLQQRVPQDRLRLILGGCLIVVGLFTIALSLAPSVLSLSG